MRFDIMNDAMDDAPESLIKIYQTDLAPEQKLRKVLYDTRYFTGDQDRETLLINEMNALCAGYRSVLI